MEPLLPEQQPEQQEGLLPETPLRPAIQEHSDEYINNTANLGALAMTRNNPQAVQNFESIASQLREAILNGNENDVRSQIAEQAKQSRINEIRARQSAILKLPDQVDGLGNPVQSKKSLLNEQLENEMSARSAVADPYSLEKDGVAQAQSAASHDPKQGEVLLHQGQDRFAEHIRDNVTKHTILQGVLDRAQEEYNNEGVGWKILDMLSLPLQSVWALRHVPGASGILPGTTLRNAVDNIMTLPLNGQFEAAAENLYPTIKQHSGLLMPNLSVTVAVLDNIANFKQPDAMSQNAWAAADLATFPGVGKGLRLLTKPLNVLRAVGNRSAAIETAAADLLKDHGGLPDGARVHAPVDAVGALIPKVSTGSLVDNSVGIMGPLVKKITNIGEAVRMNLEGIDKGIGYRANRIYDIEKTEKELALRFENDNIVDIHNPVAYVNPDKIITSIPGKVLDPLEAEAIHQAAQKDWEKFTSDLLNLKLPLNAENKVRAVPVETAILRKVDPGALFEHGVNAETGAPTITVHLGDAFGYGGYATLEDAVEGAKSRGMDPATVEYVESSGQHFIRFTQNVPETGVMVPKMTTDLPASGRIAQFLKNSNDMINQFYAGSLVRQTHIKAGLAERVVKPLFKTMVTDLSHKSRKLVKAVIDLGQREVNGANPSGYGKWYNITEFGQNFERVAGRPPTEKEILSYYAYKELNDIDWVFRNDVEWAAKNHRGTKTVSVDVPTRQFKIKETNGRELANPDIGTLGPIFDSEDGRFYAGNDLSTVRDKLASGHYRIIELESYYRDYGKDPIKIILAHKDSSTVGPLRRDQVEYVSGGHRIYQNKWFVKQAVLGRFSSQAGGGKYALTPITHSNHELYKQAKAYADKMEMARLAAEELRGPAAKRVRSVEELKRILAQTPNIGTIEKYEQLVKDGHISPDTPFRVVYEGTQLPEYAPSTENITRWYDGGMPSYEEELISRGGLYYSPKGERLVDENGQLAPVLDPFKTLDKAIGNILQAKAFHIYNTNFVEEWTRLAERAGMIDITKLGANRSPQEVFTHGVLNPALRSTPEGNALYQTLQQMRDTHKRLLNYKTKDQMNRDFAIRRFANFMENHGGKLGDMVASKAYHWSDASPVAAFRGFVFDAEIGMFNLTRLWLHSQTAMAAITVHPAYGPQAGAMAGIMHLLQLNRTPALLDTVAGWGKAVHGFEPQEFKKMVLAYQRSGWGNISGDQGMLDHYPLIQNFMKMRNAGRMPLYLAEQYNRLVGWQIAWRLTREEFPELATDSEDFLSKVHLKTDDLTMNQTSASRAAWQQGVLLPVAGQFMQYQARLLEKMLPKKFGGNSRLSATQRARLIGGQLLMYGAAGVPGLGAIAAYAGHKYQEATGRPLDDTTWRAMSKGMWDSLIFETTGVDSDVAAKGGIGSSWEDFFNDMAHGNMRSILEFFGGPSLEVTDEAVDTITTWARYFKAEQVDKLDPKTWELMSADLAKHVAGLNNFQKAYWIWQYGLLRDNKGMPVAPADKLDALATAFGIPLRVEREHGAIVQTDDEHKAYVRAMAKKVVEFRLNAARAYQEHDTQAQLYWNNMVAGWLSGESELVRDEIVKEADQESKYQGFAEQALAARSAKLTGQRPLGENH